MDENDIDRIRATLDDSREKWVHYDGKAINDLETLLDALDDANKRIANAREWAERASRHNAGSDYERDDRDMEREQCGDEVLAILDSKDTP